MFTSRLGRIVVILLAVMFMSGTVFAEGLSRSWPSAGHDLKNTRYQDKEHKIKVKNVANLAFEWQFTTGGDVSATPAVDDDTVYFPDWKGNLYALDRDTGHRKWTHLISDYTGIAGDISRATPAIAGNKLIFGDQGGYHGGDGAYVLAVDKQTGNLIWKTQVETVIFPIVTQSAVVDRGTAYVGVASAEEGLEARIPGYVCCKFRGSVVALNVDTGNIIWKTYMAPDGYSGNSVWGSTPVVDRSRNSLYVTTGNNYSVPPSVQTCVAAAGNNTAAIQACISPDDHFDSFVALDLTTGATKWATSAIPFDSWNFDCLPGLLPPGVGNPANCPTPAGPDFDFGQGPMLYTAHKPGTGKPHDFLGAGQKSGQFWALNPDTGSVIWETQVAPGGIAGGLQWGSATDGTRIYVAAANSLNKPWVVNGQTITSGFWAALDAYTGAVLWQTADPLSAGDQGAVSAANGVVYGCSLDPQGHMYAFDASTGNILWGFASGGSCNAGAAISDGTVYWGSGYSNFGIGVPNNQFYAFRLP